jgi:hypothetical protein
MRTDIRKPVVAFRTSANTPKNEREGQDMTEIRTFSSRLPREWQQNISAVVSVFAAQKSFDSTLDNH